MRALRNGSYRTDLCKVWCWTGSWSYYQRWRDASGCVKMSKRTWKNQITHVLRTRYVLQYRRFSRCI